ncbi:MAG: DEAD/DEAH box helicase [Steroidobacteraceae bacterium]
MPDDHLSSLEFASLELPPSLHRGIAELGFTHCTPIQAQTLPRALAGGDVAGQAQTGTGKTAAFLIALINRLLRSPGDPNRPVNAPRAIVIAPTRELAVQIHADAVGLTKYTGLKLALVFGGVDYDKQRRELTEGVDVVIGTPGRIIDYFKQHVFDLRHIQVAVLDEADRMFDLGFIKDIRFLLRRLPHPTHRLSMLFSATLSHRVLELAYEHMNNPELIRIEPDKMTADRVRQLLYLPSSEEKIPLLIGLLRRIDARRTMVFVNTKRMAELLERTLLANGFVAQALSGDVPQKKRLKMMRDFHSGEVAVLIATDVASRGLHIADVSHVFNFDLPQDAEDYVHRIGRTARAGAEGDAISFACDEFAISSPTSRATSVTRSRVAPLPPPTSPRSFPHPRRSGASAPPASVVADAAGPAAGPGRAVRDRAAPVPAVRGPAAGRGIRVQDPARVRTRMQDTPAGLAIPAVVVSGDRRGPPHPPAVRAGKPPSRESASVAAGDVGGAVAVVPAMPMVVGRAPAAGRRRRRRLADRGFARAASVEQLADPLYADELPRVLRSVAAVRMPHRSQLADAVCLRGPQHRQAVVDEQRARGIEGLCLMEPRPESRILLRCAEGMGGEAGIQVVREPHAIILDRQRPGMCVGDQHAPLAERVQAGQELLGLRQELDLFVHAALDVRDVEPEFAAPVVDAIPVERAHGGAELRREDLAGTRRRETVRARVVRRHQFLPEPGVEAQVEQRTVHVEQHGIDARPVDRCGSWHPGMIPSAA